MNENTEQVEGTTEEVQAEDSSYRDVLLNAEGATAEEDSSIEESQDENTEPTEEESTQEDPEITLADGRTVKLSEVQEWEQGYMRQQDYSKKTQEVSDFRKPFEEAFGRIPGTQEVQALGTIWNAYFDESQPLARGAIKAIIDGQLESFIADTAGLQEEVDGQQPGEQNQEVLGLRKQIKDLENKLTGYVQQQQSVEQQRQMAEGNRLFTEWKQQKEADDKVKITDDIDKAMQVWEGPLLQAHPDWDSNKILNEAYRHATLDTIESSTAKKVLKQADDVKKTNPPKITPTSSDKAESDMSYAELIRSS